MRVAINALPVEGGGGLTYLQEMVPALRRQGPAHGIRVILAPDQQPLLGELAAGGAIAAPGAPRSAWRRMLWEQARLPGLLAAAGVDLLFAPFNTALLRTRLPVVLGVQNCNPYSRLPLGWSAYARLRHAGLRGLGRLSARAARRVVFVSETSARVIAPRLGLASDRVRVVPHGWTAAPGPSVAPPLPARFLLTVADLQPHKNLETLLTAFERLHAAEAYAGDLVIVGGAKAGASAYARQFRAFHAGLAGRARIHLLGTVPRATLAAIYRRAELFVFPSLEEAFGLPLLEAMGAGVPVIAADWRRAPGGDRDRVNAAPEVCGDAAEYFDPTSPAALAEAVRELLEAPERRAALAERGRTRAHGFSWDAAAAALLSVFAEAAKERAA